MALLKDEIDADLVALLAREFEAVTAEFDGAGFRDAVLDRLDDLELKDRINLIADALADRLPADYRRALDIVVRVAVTEPGAWAAWPLCSFVERHGLDDPEASLAAMPELTKQWSCEFAIRPYLRDHLDLTRTHLRRWVLDADERVRRLTSEGTRPLLPWGPKVPVLSEDPAIGLELLTALRHDPSEDVRRSVANHLNDVAKSNADLVVAVLQDWTSEAEPVDEAMVRHALRTLVKKGHAGALELLGFTTDPEITVDRFACHPDRVTLGGRIRLEATLTSTAETEQRLVVDFVIHHVNASGETSPKVFKWTTCSIRSGETIELTKRRSIVPASTRTYHPGVHRVDLQVGGRTVGSTRFDLVTPP